MFRFLRRHRDQPDQPEAPEPSVSRPAGPPPDATQIAVALVAAAACDPPLPEREQRVLMQGADAELVAMRVALMLAHIGLTAWGPEMMRDLIEGVGLQVARIVEERR